MKNICLLCLVFGLFAQRARATDQVSADSILTVLKEKDAPRRQKQLLLCIRHYFQGRPVGALWPAKKKLDSILVVYPVPDAFGIKLFSKAIYSIELKQYELAEKDLADAISIGDQENDHYLLYACFTQLAFLQSLKGNMPEAVVSFRQAHKEAVLLDDAYLQVMADINISDIYYQNKLHKQSLLYLDQAEKLMWRQQITEPMFSMVVLVNKTENYFDLGEADSLAKYNRKLLGLKVSSERLYTYQQRSNYSLLLLLGYYNTALGRIIALKQDSGYSYDLVDEQNLATAYYHTGQLDSARTILAHLIADPSLKNHPELTLPLYEMLGHISLAQANKTEAILHFDDALQQAKKQISRLIGVDTIAARIKMDDLQGNYIRREERFKRERLWLIIGIVTICVTSLISAMLYRAIRQKRHFEKLAYEAKRNELAFINSHEVRRHLSNILGIIDTVRHSENRHAAYVEVETHLLKAAEQLDNSIRHISDKLDG